MSTIPEHIANLRQLREEAKEAPINHPAQLLYQSQCYLLVHAHLEEIAQVLEDDEFNYLLQGRLAKILNDTANVLKGPPDELALHSTHDLAKVSERIVIALQDLRREVLDLLKMHPEVSQHSLLSALQAASDALPNSQESVR
jgi:hypothetical protein